tara:strand:- start:4333 stop:4896 length:564 start_codon:yes stop_codon:yes gene_type:complete
MKNIVLKILLLINYYKIINYFFIKLPFELKLNKYELESKQKINFVNQGAYTLYLLGDLNKFNIHETSHLKSDTVIECTGGVEIGRYFHTGKGLTIFSTNHNYDNKESIPYSPNSIIKPVVIKDFVWLGANVTIVPGVTIGEGVVVGAGSVVTRDIPDCAIIGGNPASIIKYRDKESFYNLKTNKNFF